MRFRSAAENLGIFLIGVVVSVGLLEIGCRIFLPRPGFVEWTAGWPKGLIEPHVSRGFVYAPGFSGAIRTSWGSYNVDINGGGFRDHDGLVEDAAIKILALGDSFTFGWGVEESDAWPARLEQILSEEWMDGRSISVLNTGVSAYSLNQIHDVARHLLAEMKPNVVILGFWPHAAYRLEDPYTYHEGFSVRSSWTHRLLATPDGLIMTNFTEPGLRAVEYWLKNNSYAGGYLIDLAARTYWFLVKLGESSKSGETGEADDLVLNRIKREMAPLFETLLGLNTFIDQQRSTLVVLVIPPQHGDGRIQYDGLPHNIPTLTHEFCAMHGLLCVDGLQAFKTYPGDKVELIHEKGDTHWSKRGHELAAQTVAEYLLNHDLLP